MATGVEAPVKRRWGFNIGFEWVWIFTEDIREWHYIDVEWAANLERPDIYGFVAAEEIHVGEPHVPAVIEAMVRRGLHKIRKPDHKNFIHSFGKKELEGPAPPMGRGGGLPAELFFFQTLMVDHPRLADYEKRLVKWHEAETKKERRQAKEPHGDEGGDQESSSSEEEHDHGMNNALSFVALDNMDEDNRKEWMKEGKMKQLSGLAGCKRMAQDILRAEREAARDAYVNGAKR